MMIQCVNSGIHGEDGVVVDVFGCASCQTLWCPQCGPHSAICPKCGSEQIEQMTLSDDAYL